MNFKAEYPSITSQSISLSVPKHWEFYVDMLLKAFSWNQQHESGWEELQVLQVKEKFGTLRVYAKLGESASDADRACLNGMVSMVERLSANTCAECGSHTDVKICTTQTSKWLLPRCPAHQ